MWVRVETARRTVRERPVAVHVAGLAGLAPQLDEPVDDRRRRVAGHHRAVQRPHAGAEHQVGDDAPLEQRLEHPDLDRPQHPAAHRARTPSSCRPSWGSPSRLAPMRGAVHTWHPSWRRTIPERAGDGSRGSRRGPVGWPGARPRRTGSGRCRETRVTRVKRRSQRGLAGEQEGHDHEDHVEPAVGDAEVLRDVGADLPGPAALGQRVGEQQVAVVQRQPDEHSTIRAGRRRSRPSRGSGGGRRSRLRGYGGSRPGRPPGSPRRRPRARRLGRRGRWPRRARAATR